MSPISWFVLLCMWMLLSYTGIMLQFKNICGDGRWAVYWYMVFTTLALVLITANKF